MTAAFSPVSMCITVMRVSVAYFSLNLKDSARRFEQAFMLTLNLRVSYENDAQHFSTALYDIHKVDKCFSLQVLPS